MIYTVWDTPLGMISEIVPAQSYSGNGGGSDGGGSGVPLRQESALPLNHWERLGIGPGVMLDGKAVIAFRFREKGAPHREEIYFADRSAIQRMRPGRGDYEVTPIYEGADLLEFVQNKVNTKDTCFEMTGDGNPKAGRGRSVQSARVTSKGMEFDIHAFLPRKTWLHFELDKKGVLVGGEDKVFTPIIRVKDDKGKICRVNLSNFFFKSGASKLWPLSSSVGRSDITNTEPEQPELTVSAEGEEDHPVFIDMAHPMTCKEGGLRESQDCAECRRTKESELLKLPNIEALGLK